MDLKIFSEDELRQMSVEDLKQLKREYWAYATGHELPDWVPWIVTNLGDGGSYIDPDFAIAIRWNRENGQWSVRAAGRLVMAEGIFVPGYWLRTFHDLYDKATQKAEEHRYQRSEIQRQKLIEELRPV